MKPIFICGVHKSGTSLLRSLLDGHPKLAVLPIESHFINHIGFEVNYNFRRQFKTDFVLDDFFLKCNKLIDHYNNAPDFNKSDAQLNGRFDTNIFNDNLIKKINHNTSFDDMFIDYLDSIFLALNQKIDIKNKRLVEKSVENGEVALYYNKIFPNSKFIHIVRNPYANLVSLRKFKSSKGYPNIRTFLSVLNDNFYSIEKNKEIIGDNYFIVKYEDILERPKSTRKEISKFLGISYNENILLTPTSLGEIWKGNSFDSKETSDINNEGMNKWQNHIFPIETSLINHFLKKRIVQYGYNIYNSKNSRTNFFPIRGENFKTYILNRMCKYFPF